MRGFIIEFPLGYAPPDDWSARLPRQSGTTPRFAQVTVTGAPGEPPQPRNAAFKLWYGVPTTITPDSVVEQAFMDPTIPRILRAFGVAEHLTVNVIGPFESPAFDKAMLTALTEREQHTKPGAG